MGFDVQGNTLDFINIVSETNANYFFERRKLNIADKYYFVRGIVYNSSKTALSATDGALNIGYGENLRFNVSHNSLIPIIKVDNLTGSPSNEVNIWNVKIQPLGIDNVCFLDHSKWIHILLKNRNGSYNTKDLYDIFRKYFIPYNTEFSMKNTGIQ
jgi:hypothetical protein